MSHRYMNKSDACNSPIHRCSSRRRSDVHNTRIPSFLTLILNRHLYYEIEASKYFPYSITSFLEYPLLVSMRDKL